MDALLEPIIETGKETFCVEIMKRLDCQRRNEHLCDVNLEVGSNVRQFAPQTIRPRQQAPNIQTISPHYLDD